MQFLGIHFNYTFTLYGLWANCYHEIVDLPILCMDVLIEYRKQRNSMFHALDFTTTHVAIQYKARQLLFYSSRHSSSNHENWTCALRKTSKYISLRVYHNCWKLCTKKSNSLKKFTDLPIRKYLPSPTKH